ncbi:MAG: NRDE family protein [Gammaproteobacteria bacterium]|nr:NRDE family protein [Gammaproteobacteria bacterium]MDP6617622.1 NRDE family protein [Gammaproteobacteria bacterium]MDP6694499.1 NRDE family protein [Gammaproteobacteria bacterium]
MCLLSIAWQVHPDYPLVFLGNRDEFHARPAAAADWWQDNPDVLGGIDLEAGGSWLGMNRAGRFAVVTNRPDLPAPETNARSRGELVTAWLKNETPSAIDLLSERNALYGGFGLLLATPGKLQRLTGGNGAELRQDDLPAGIYGLSNTAVDDPWPKLTWLNHQLGHLLETGPPDHGTLLELLLYDEPVAADTEPRVAAVPFIEGADYGTRSASVVTVNNAGHCRFTERRFGPGGRPMGTSEFDFQVPEST